MDTLFSDFPKQTLSQWIDQLHKDLKGKPNTLLQIDDPIEQISFSAYQHQDSDNTHFPDAFHVAPIRNTHRENNAWENMATIIVNQETTANQQALQVLNLGITSLRFSLPKSPINWGKLLHEIQLKYIQTTFKIPNATFYFSLLEKYEPEELQSVFFELDWMNISVDDWDQLAVSLNRQPRPIFCANGYAFQQCGSNTWQEIAYCLASAHEFLVQLTNRNISTDIASQCIHFTIGASTNYFFEIAKIRALRLLWARIIEEYKPEKEQALATRITGLTGFTNKSLRDPYTNLLRQTTEAMSLVLSGVHAVCVQPYDQYSSNGSNKLSRRMAINIPLILQEESFLDKVIDPLGGSYAVEHLTHKIADQAWSTFQQIEEFGGIQNVNARHYLIPKVQQTARLRQQRIADKTDTLIGINEFPNPTKENNKWLPLDVYLDMPALILEQTMVDHE